MIWEIDDDRPAIEGLDADGRPDPSYAAALGLIPAPFGRRVLSTAIESFAVLLLLLPMLLIVIPAVTSIASSPNPAAALQQRGDLIFVVIAAAVSTFGTNVFIIVQLVLHGRRGVTLGKAFTGIRSVNVRTLERPWFWRGAVVRYLVLYGSMFVPLLGPALVAGVSVFLDPEGRGRSWADRVAATWFVDSKRGLNPYDAKRMRIARKEVATELRDEKDVLPSLATAANTAPEAYVPTMRHSGGVLGLPRAEGYAPIPDVAPSGTPAAGALAPAVQPRYTAQVIALLTLDNNDAIEIRPPGIVVGRNPVAAQTSPGLIPVPIIDDTRSVSKTHFEIHVGGTQPFVVDRGSTNGVTLVRAGAKYPLAPGEPLVLDDGDEITFGDRAARFTAY